MVYDLSKLGSCLKTFNGKKPIRSDIPSITTSKSKSGSKPTKRWLPNCFNENCFNESQALGKDLAS